MISKKGAAKKHKAKKNYSQKTVNAIVRHIAAEAAANANANIAKEWLLWEVACQIADRFGVSHQIKTLLKNPARDYADQKSISPSSDDPC